MGSSYSQHATKTAIIRQLRQDADDLMDIHGVPTYVIVYIIANGHDTHGKWFNSYAEVLDYVTDPEVTLMAYRDLRVLAIDGRNTNLMYKELYAEFNRDPSLMLYHFKSMFVDHVHPFTRARRWDLETEIAKFVSNIEEGWVPGLSYRGFYRIKHILNADNVIQYTEDRWKFYSMGCDLPIPATIGAS
jgi:hypothetical protein